MFKLKYLGFLAAFILVVAIIYKIFFAHGAPGAANGGAGAAMPASVSTVIEKQVEVWSEFSGRLEATDKVEIHPQVGGTIQKILFQEGSLVNKGDSLFIIDQRPFLAELQRAEANLVSAKSQMQYSAGEFKRAEALLKTDVISKSRYDARQSETSGAQANEKSAEAALNLARLKVEYSNIRAPISGRISRAEITEGNLVDPAQPQALASIVSVDPIYAEFNIDEQTYLKYVGVSDPNADVTKIPVEINLAGADAPTVHGFLRSFDNQLDAKSGTIRARATFANADGKLLPGLFAKVRLGSTDKVNALLITDRAVGTDQDKKFVFVVGADNKIQYRPVKLGGIAEGLRIIESGLKPGEKIIVTGLFKFRPDMPVIPSEVPMEGTQAAAQEVKETGSQTDTQKLDAKPAEEKTPAEPAKK